MRLSVNGDSDSGNLAAVIDAAGSQGPPPGSLRKDCVEVEHFPQAIEKPARATGADDLPCFVDGKSRTLLILQRSRVHHPALLIQPQAAGHFVTWFACFSRCYFVTACSYSCCVMMPLSRKSRTARRSSPPC